MNVKLNGLTRVSEGSSREGFRYPLVTNIKGFYSWTPEAQIGAVVTEGGLSMMALGIACIRTSNVLSTPEVFPSAGPSTLNPNMNKATFKKEVLTGEINPFLEGVSKNFISEIKPILEKETQDIESIKFMSTVKVDENGQVEVEKYLWTFNDQLIGQDNQTKDYLANYTFVTVTNTNGEQTLYLYNQLTADGETGSFSHTDEAGNTYIVPTLTKVNMLPDETNKRNAIVYGEGISNESKILFPLLVVENAYDENGVYIGGTIASFNHSTGAISERVVDNLNGVVGAVNITANLDGDMLKAEDIFGNPSILPPPTPDFIDVNIKYTSNNSGSQIIATPTFVEVVSTPTATAEATAMVPAVNISETFKDNQPFYTELIKQDKNASKNIQERGDNVTLTTVDGKHYEVDKKTGGVNVDVNGNPLLVEDTGYVNPLTLHGKAGTESAGKVFAFNPDYKGWFEVIQSNHPVDQKASEEEKMKQREIAINDPIRITSEQLKDRAMSELLSGLMIPFPEGSKPDNSLYHNNNEKNPIPDLNITELRTAKKIPIDLFYIVNIGGVNIGIQGFEVLNSSTDIKQILTVAVGRGSERTTTDQNSIYLKMIYELGYQPVLVVSSSDNLFETDDLSGLLPQPSILSLKQLAGNDPAKIDFLGGTITKINTDPEYKDVDKSLWQWKYTDPFPKEFENIIWLTYFI